MFCGLFSEIILLSVYALLLSVFVLQLTFCRSLWRICLHFVFFVSCESGAELSALYPGTDWRQGSRKF